MSDKKEGNKMQKKVFKSWSGEIAYIIEDNHKSYSIESPRQDEIKIDEPIKSTIKLDEDRLNSIRLLKTIKDSMAVQKALCEHNEIPHQNLLIQNKINANIGTVTFKKFEQSKSKPGPSKETNYKKPPNYLKLWNEKHKLDVLKSKDDKFLRTVGKVSNKVNYYESNVNPIKSGRKISYAQDNFKRGKISELDNERNKYGSQRKPEISPTKFSPIVQKFYLNSSGTKQNASVNANFKRELIEFKSGTSDFLKNMSVNATNNQPIEIKIAQKSGIGRKITNFLSSSINEFENDSTADLIGMIPFVQPKSIAFYSETPLTNQGASANFQDIKPVETIQENNQDLRPNDSHVINSEQKNIRKTLINGHDFSQDSNFSFKPKNGHDFSQDSNFSFKPKKKFGSNLSYRMGGYIPFNQRDEYVYMSKPARTPRITNFPTSGTGPVGKECKCHEQTLPMTAQKVDMTPFLVQLLESCLKVPETLKNIRNVNNTFVNDLQQWRSFSYNLVGQNKISDKKSKSAEKIAADDTGCQTCEDCHQILKKIMGILNEKHTKPCMDTNYPGGISCKNCGCGKNQERSQFPGFKPCECTAPEPAQEAAEPAQGVAKPQRPIQKRQSVAQKTPAARSSHDNDILSYYAKCSVPHQKSLNYCNMERKTLHQPRCAAVDFDSDLSDSSCSHCSSCSSCSNC